MATKKKTKTTKTSGGRTAERNESVEKQERPKDMRFCRHGDLIIDRMPGPLPPGLRSDPSKILASADSTGHPHTIGNGARILRPEQPRVDGMFFVEVVEPDGVSHERHGPVPFEVGALRVVPKRQWVLGSQEQVRD